MRNPYYVTFTSDTSKFRTGVFSPVIIKRFKNHATAIKFAEKVSRKILSPVTRYSTRRENWVDVYKDGCGIVYEVQPEIVPSVGELGYW